MALVAGAGRRCTYTVCTYCSSNTIRDSNTLALYSTTVSRVVSAGQGRRVNNITTESNTTKMIHERCTKCTVNTGVTLQQYERVIVRNNLRAPVNTDPTKPIHTASVTGRITGRRGRSQ